MFDGVAARYDRTNTRALLRPDRALAPGHPGRRSTCAPGERCLDLAAGTGVSTEELARSGAFVVGADLSLGMLARRPPGPPGTCRCSPATRWRCPSPTRAFDAVTISFGLRNIVDTAGGAAGDGPGDPARRSAGGLRVQRTRSTARSAGSTCGYLMRALPAVARRVSSQPGRLRLPRRVDPRLAGPGGARRVITAAGLVRGRLAQPHRRRRRPPPRHPPLTRPRAPAQAPCAPARAPRPAEIASGRHSRCGLANVRSLPIRRSRRSPGLHPVESHRGHPNLGLWTTSVA